VNNNFHKLFSEFEIGQCTLRNRIVSTGHHTYLADKHPDEKLIAYHEARARGGAGLIVSEIVAVHESAGFSKNLLTAENENVIPAYRQLVNATHRHDTRIFAQLFHPGREILSSPNGMLPVAWAPSAVPNERFHIMPKVMSTALIRDIIDGYGRTAAVLTEAGFDGFEIVASHGYLPSQFLNAHTNLRDDEYGGDETRRLRFLTDVITSIRKSSAGRVLGLRISADELDGVGLTQEQVQKICSTLAPELDYISITAGTSASLGASVHITPPMGVEHAYMAPQSARLRQLVDIPIVLTGRINHPQIAEQVLLNGEADLCGMTRALICDPHMPVKAQSGQVDAIRACIGCNQACIGRAHKGVGISCIQYPESGRELQFASLNSIRSPRKIIVAGGGPAGMKAAITAAHRGHEVQLFESAAELGGQALLAQQLPGREEFGGIVSNLQFELQKAGVQIITGQEVSVELVIEQGADRVIVATGATPYIPVFEGSNDESVVSAWDVLADKVSMGHSVVIADWRADWIGLGLAEKLARAGSSVTLCVNAAMAGETLQIYTRNHYVGRLQKLGINLFTHARLFGCVDGTVFFQNTLTDEAMEFEGVDNLVLSLGHKPHDDLEHALHAEGIDSWSIGDCVAVRSAEEAVYEGLITGNSI